MTTIKPKTPREREIYLAGVRNGLEYAQKQPNGIEKALEVADLELMLVHSL